MCGIVGIISNQAANYQLYDALMMLQHRGQDAAGMTTISNNRFYHHKQNGLLSEVFADETVLATLEGLIGIGHVRYPTVGSEHAVNEAQPLYINEPVGISLAHNGNTTNTSELRKYLAESGINLKTFSDSELLLNLFAYAMNDALLAGKNKKEAVFHAAHFLHQKVSGAFCLVVLVIGLGLIAIRDKFGIRPFVLGKRDSGEYVVASESVALDILGFKYLRDIEAGETLIIEDNGVLESRVYECSQLRPCLFEYVYLARPDSYLNGASVAQARMNMGVFLAKQIGRDWRHLDIDVVIPIPDTSRTAAYELACYLHKPYREGFIKNRYIGRTFIAPHSAQRSNLVKRKLNPMPHEFRDKKVLLVDDSIVRGTTSQLIINMVRECGAKAVYMCSAAPAVRYQNIYGIDMPTRSELIVNRYQDHETLCSAMGLDALIYQTLDDLETSVNICNSKLDKFEASVFNGEYITEGVDTDYLQQLAQDRSHAQLEFGFPPS